MRRVALTLLFFSLPVPGAPAWAAPTTPVVRPVTMKVKAGDTLYRLARTHHLSVVQLRRWNGLSGNVIHVGQVLRLRPPATPAAVTRPVAAPVKPALVKPPPAKPAAARPAPVPDPVKPAAPAVSRSGGIYTVKRGDTLGVIARRAGVSVEALQQASGLKGTLLQPGQRLRVPPRGTVAAAPAVVRVPALPAGKESRLVYTYVRVGRGETATGLAARYRTTPDALRRLNGLSTVQMIVPGAKVLVPSRVAVPVPPAALRSAVSYRAARPLNIPVQVVQVDLRWRNVLVAPVLPGRGLSFASGATVGSLARTSGARAVVNGSYFHPHTYAPAGDIVMQGRLLTWGRIPAALAITPDNRASIAASTTALFSRPLDTSWSGMETVVATGPRIVTRGAVQHTYSGIFQDPALFGRAARSAVGLLSNRDLLLVTTHARLTTVEMGKVMASLGARDALLLDGGSSAGLAWNGAAVLDSVRKVSYGIGVFANYTGRRYAR
ncbi:LysM peptidoglycan-binding domain-containing protein [Deinococcus sp. Leaf326]|uniref:LysM peptidoglycan-binding domain-containing protein n=1 Tax=Deinococcus sp. Leaf326 TaxID=1736338 RepID=UPI0006FD9C59|nr:LysM peptidoglycan-binding domain-containing protein [Deinococcus sp. Leaf326]KQQ99390.1 peptidoglycan-binding protein [Deinococcus sp. Leaf326]